MDNTLRTGCFTLNHYQAQILDSSELKEFADDNFKFDKNRRKFSKQIENTVGKREIACYKQFSFSHSVFKRLVSQGRQKVSLCGNGLNQTIGSLNKIQKEGFGKKLTRENHCEKRRSCFPQCFLPIWRTFCRFHQISVWTSLVFCHIEKSSPFSKQALVFMCLDYASFENTVEKGEIAVTRPAHCTIT